jgi:hypothetical protein
VLKRGCQAHFNRDDEARRSWPRRGTDANTAKRAGMVAEHGNNGRARGYTINTAFTVEAQRRQGRPPQDMISAARDTEGRNAEEIDISVDCPRKSRRLLLSLLLRYDIRYRCIQHGSVVSSRAPKGCFHIPLLRFALCRVPADLLGRAFRPAI